MQDPKIAKNSPSGYHRTNLSGYAFATKAHIDNRKKSFKQQCLPHMSSQYGKLRPTSGWDLLASLGHPATFQWVSRLGSVTARHSSSGRQPNFPALSRGRHLYPAGRPSRWALAHDYLRSHCYDIFNAMLPVFTYDRFRRNLAWWRSLALLSFPIVKIYKIWKSKMAVAAILESKNHHILAKIWPLRRSRSTIFVPIESSYATSY